MKLYELRLRGSGFTLGTIVNSSDHDLLRELISYLQITATGQDPDVPDSFKLIPNSDFSSERCTKFSKQLLDRGYLKKSEKDNSYILTQKTLDVFEKTVAKDNELSKEGFSYCPCSSLFD